MQRHHTRTGTPPHGARMRGGDARALQRVLHYVGLSFGGEYHKDPRRRPSARTGLFRHRLRLVQARRQGLVQRHGRLEGEPFSLPARDRGGIGGDPRRRAASRHLVRVRSCRAGQRGVLARRYAVKARRQGRHIQEPQVLRSEAARRQRIYNCPYDRLFGKKRVQVYQDRL